MSLIKILGIESSCDDTAVAIIDSRPEILANLVISQNDEHAVFQGVVPEIAARSHLNNLQRAFDEALATAKLKLADIDAIAATCGPGLIGGVIVGSMFAKALASVTKKPFIAVNHLEGHALTVRLTNGTPYPYLLLLASGGHCRFAAIRGLGDYVELGETLDDSVGEAFDKVAKMLGLGFPGGPQIELYAKSGDADAFSFPKPLISRKSCDMSFSGLKTAVRLTIDKLKAADGRLSSSVVCDIAASFQKTVAKILAKKTFYAIESYERLLTETNSEGDSHGKSIVISGGVGANMYIRRALEEVASKVSYSFVAPPIKLCTDNAAMIAFAGLERFNAGIINDISFRPRARWGLSEV